MCDMFRSPGPLRPHLPFLFFPFPCETVSFQVALSFEFPKLFLKVGGKSLALRSLALDSVAGKKALGWSHAALSYLRMTKMHVVC